MICARCKRGGILNADANRAYDPESARTLREAAISAHEECNNNRPGPQAMSHHCDCQHKVVDWAIRRGY